MPKKETLAIDAMMQMFTGMSLDEAVDIWVKEGDEAAQKIMFEAAANKRKQDNLMSFANMMKRPEKKEDEGTFICPHCKSKAAVSTKGEKGLCHTCTLELED